MTCLTYGAGWCIIGNVELERYAAFVSVPPSQPYIQGLRAKRSLHEDTQSAAIQFDARW